MTRQLDSLQILRGLAATLVVFDHLVSACLQKFGRHDVGLEGLWFAGALGVHVFFCISGYIITQSLLSASEDMHPMRTFYRRRFVRVVPLYWLATALYALRLLTKGEPPSPDELLRSLLFVPYADAQGQMRPVLGLGWSLNFEMLFYLVLGLSLWWRSRLAVAGVVAALLLPLWLIALLHPAPPWANGVGLLVNPVLGYFIAGVALAYLAPWLARQGWLPALGAGPQALCQLVVLAGLVALVLAWPAALPWVEMVQILLSVGLVLLCALQPQQVDSPNWLLTIAKKFGDASYSTYLSHALLVTTVAVLLSHVPGLAGAHFAVLSTVCLLLLPLFNAVGLLVHRRVELPLMAWVSRCLAGTSRAVAPVR